MAVSVKMGVDFNAFLTGIEDAKAAVKTFDAEMKLIKATFENTGNSEKALEDALKNLDGKLTAQKAVVEQYQAALQTMAAQGIDPASKAYQDMAKDMITAQTELAKTEGVVNDVGAAMLAAGADANVMAEDVTEADKKMTFSEAIKGVEGFVGTLQEAGREIVNVASDYWDSIMDIASWSDDVATLAERMGLTTDQVQRMRIVADQFEAPVEMLAKTWKRVRMSMSSDEKGIKEAWEQLGIATEGRDYIDVFWEIGDALKNMSDASLQERYAQKLLGRSWDELIPLFNRGREAYEKALEDQTTTGDDAIQKNAALKDSVSALSESFEGLQASLLSSVAPLLTGFVDGLKWIVDKHGEVVAAVEAIAVGWAGIKITGSLLEMIELIKGLKGLGLIKGAGTAASAASGGGLTTAALGGIKAFLMAGGAIPLAVLGMGLLPAGIANEQDYAQARLTLQNRQQLAADSMQKDQLGAQFLERAAKALDQIGTREDGSSGWGDMAEVESILIGLSDRKNQQLAELYNLISVYGKTTSDGQYTWNQLQRFWAGEDMSAAEETAILEAITGAYEKALSGENAPKVEVNPEVPANAASDISNQIGTVSVQIQPVMNGLLEHFGAQKANGIWSVPYDGYLATLHRGERVLPAREVASKSYSSNLYVESMYMTGNTDAAGLAAAMAAAQRREMAGYGS